jgi:glycosyltransferase involved in cell wall biosynthesis
LKKPLTTKARRTDLTDRELASILGGLIGGLCDSADIDDIRNAVRWWAETDEAWEEFKSMRQMMKELSIKETV